MRLQARGKSMFGGIPRWAKPSTFTAMTGVVAGGIELVATPLPNGDNWINRLVNGHAAYVAGGKQDPTLLLNVDEYGNNLVTVLGAQLKQNAAGAVVTVGGFGIAAAIMKKFGL